MQWFAGESMRKSNIPFLTRASRASSTIAVEACRIAKFSREEEKWVFERRMLKVPSKIIDSGS